jgi:hypothetical protein
MGVQNVSRCERDGLEMTPGFYTNRGEKGKRGRGVAHLPLMVGGATAKRRKGKGKWKGFGGETVLGITALD